MQKSAKNATLTITTIAVLTALGVICSLPFPFGLTFRVVDFMKFSPMFIIIAIAASRYGIIAAALVAGLSDTIQSFLGTAGAINLGILLSSVLTGLIFGLFLQMKITVPRILASVIISQIVCSLGITTYFLVLMGFPFIPMIYFRLFQTAIYLVLQISILYIILIKFSIVEKIRKIS